MAWSSTVPDATDALVAALRADPALSGIVWDGQELRDEAAQEAVFVGWTGVEDEDTAAEGSNTRQGLAVQPDREQYSIRCAASVLNGSGDISAARRRAYELLAVVGAVIAADSTLGGTVMAASIGEWTLSTAQTSLGAVATITFATDVDAYTNL